MVKMGACSRNCCRHWVRDNIQLITILVGIVIGIIIGFVLQKNNPSNDLIMAISFPGEIFLRIFNVCIIPLIFFCLLSGVSAIDPKSNGKVGGLALLYLVFVDLLGTTIGVLLALAIKPGSYMLATEEKTTKQVMMNTEDIFLDLVRNIFPDNIVRATLQKVRTGYEKQMVEEVINNVTNVTTEYSRTLVAVNSTNLLGILMFCILFGMAIGSLGKQTAIIREFTAAGSAITLRVLQWTMWLCPIGVASLTAGALMRQKNLGSLFVRLGMLVITTVSGNMIQVVLIFPLIFLVTTRTNPWSVFSKCGRLYPMAFALCSSIVIMPEYFVVCKANKYSSKVCAMVVPLITTIVACGSALYIGASAVFLAQYAQIPLNAAQLLIIILLGTLSSMALPASPSGSIIVVMMMMNSLQIPVHMVGVLFTVDWFLDRVRTATNGMGKIFGMAIIAILCKDMDIPEQEKENHQDKQEMKPFVQQV